VRPSRHLGLGPAIGGEDAELKIPSIGFTDFTALHRFGPLTWYNIATFLNKKYSRLSSQANADEKRDADRLEAAAAKYTARGAAPKGILIFPGRWKGLSTHEAILLAQRLAGDSPHYIFVAIPAHPHSTAENAKELNPNYTGPSTAKFISCRYFYDSAVCMGERNLAGDICFNYSHNIRKFLIVQVINTDTPPPQPLLAPVSRIQPKTYKGCNS